MRKIYFYLLFISFFLPVLVFAQEGVVFPVEELGDCRNFRECANYCDNPENFKICNDFAQAHGMVVAEEGERARKMLEAAEMGGPGGCKGQVECETYCRVPDHMEECIVFGLENNLMPPEERSEVEKALAAIRKGAKPPPCGGPKECDLYCSEPEHLDECLAFGEAAGFISPEEAEMVRKTGGKGPGGCRGKQECDDYCQVPDHMEECINFGLEHGVIPPEEIENVKKTLEALKKGVKPPNCRGREECDVYCSWPEHAEECVDFAIAAGFITPEEAEQAKKMAKLGIMSGPGGCKGKEECKAYCDNPEHMFECIEFAEKAGFMSPEEAEKSRKMGESGIMMGEGPGGCRGPEECEEYCSQPENMPECMEFGQKHGLMPPEEVEKAQKIMEVMPQGGPGGCRTPEECKTYCDDPTHMQECVEFGQRMAPPPEGMAPPEGMIQPEEMLPSGEILPPKEILAPPGEITPPPPIEEAPQTLLDIFKLLANFAIPFLR